MHLLANLLFLSPLLENIVRPGKGLVAFVVILGIMVLIHELGHFLVAKAFGVRVLAFSIGFGKRLFGVVHNGTDYKVCALPLGGYVMMAGESEMPGAVQTTTEGDEAPQPIAAQGVPLTELPRWQRALIALAGPVSNLLLAFLILLFTGLVHFERPQFLDGPATVDYVPQGTSAARAGLQAGDTITSFDGRDNPTWETVLDRCSLNSARGTVPMRWQHTGAERIGTFSIEQLADLDDVDKLGLLPRIQTGPIVVQKILPNTPAAAAGLQPGDRLIRVDGISFHSIAGVLAHLRDGNGAPVHLDLERGNGLVQLTVTPQLMDSQTGTRQYKLGFQQQPPPAQVVQLPLKEAAHQAWTSGIHSAGLIVQVLQGLFTRHVSVKSMSGPVGIEQQVSEAANQGVWPLLELSTMISINLAIFNLLPIPILDGGMLLFLLIEGVSRRDVDARVKERVYQVAFVCIMVLFAFIMFNDISRLLHRPS